MPNGISTNELNKMIGKYQTPPQPPHPDRQLYPIVLAMKSRSCRRLHVSSVLRLHCMHCFFYPEFLLSKCCSDYVAMVVENDHDIYV